MNEKYKKIEDPKSVKVLERIKKKDDFDTKRILRHLKLPDLTRTEGSPLKFIVEAILTIPRFDDFDIVEVPEIVSVKNNFDLLNTPPDHPSRRKTDTYYLEKDWVLRTQTTVMWPFHLSEENRKKLEKEGEIGALCYGKAYRKDEIDRSHYPVFHQIDGWYICRKTKKNIGVPELKEVLVEIAKSIYGNDVKYQFSEDSFPFTDPSIEMAVLLNDEWLEILGAGVVHPKVLKGLGVDPKVYNGWAFGFGLERIAMAKMKVPDIRIFWSEDPRITKQFKGLNSIYQEISKYPMSYRDISFIVNKNESLNNYYEIVRDCAGDLVEEVKLIDVYENEEKFGKDKVSRTFRIIYRSHERTLTNEEVDKIHQEIEFRTKKEFNATVR